MIVGIGHVARVGKDTAAMALCRELGYRQVAFADKLKQLAVGMDPLVTSATQRVNVGVGHGRLAWVVKGLGWEGAKDTYPEVRLLLQRLGLTARELFGEDFWIEQALGGLPNDARVVVSDVRFPNEAQAIRDRGGILIKIDRPGRQALGHVSETALSDFRFDHVVVNDGSIAELEQKVVRIVRDALPPVLSEDLL